MCRPPLITLFLNDCYTVLQKFNLKKSYLSDYLSYAYIPVSKKTQTNRITRIDTENDTNMVTQYNMIQDGLI